MHVLDLLHQLTLSIQTAHSSAACISSITLQLSLTSLSTCTRMSSRSALSFNLTLWGGRRRRNRMLSLFPSFLLLLVYGFAYQRLCKNFEGLLDLSPLKIHFQQDLAFKFSPCPLPKKKHQETLAQGFLGAFLLKNQMDRVFLKEKRIFLAIFESYMLYFLVFCIFWVKREFIAC